MVDWQGSMVQGNPLRAGADGGRVLLELGQRSASLQWSLTMEDSPAGPSGEINGVKFKCATGLETNDRNS